MVWGHEAGVGWIEALFPACQSQKHFLFTEAGCCRGAAGVGVAVGPEAQCIWGRRVTPSVFR